MKKTLLALITILSLVSIVVADTRKSKAKPKPKSFTKVVNGRTTTTPNSTTPTSPTRISAAEMATIPTGEVGREFWVKDGTGGLYRDYGSAIGIQRVNACISPFDIKLIPKDNSAKTRLSNSAAWDAWMTSLPAKGACIQFPEGEFYFQTTLTFRKPIKLLGAGSQYVAGDATTGTALIVESGQNGITVAIGAKNSMIQGVLLRTRSGNNIATGDGINTNTTVRIDQVVIESFGRDGIFFNGTAPANSDFSSVTDSHAWFVRRDGLHLDGGSDTNVIQVTIFNATNSGRHGVYNAGASNVFSNLHVAFAGLVVKGSAAYYEAGSSNIYLNPYSEDGEKFYFGQGSNYNTVISGIFGTPVIDPTAPGIHGGHNIIERGAYRGLRLREITNSNSGHQYSLQSGYYNYPGEIILRDETASKTVFSYDPAKTTLHVPTVSAAAAKIGTNGATMSYVMHGAGSLTAGTVTIANPNITANSRVLVTRTSKGTGVLYVSAKTSGVSFTVSSSDGSDNGTFDYWIVN